MANLVEKKPSPEVAITNSSLDEVQRLGNNEGSSHDDRDDARYHLAGINLYFIVLALCLSVILVALVCENSG
jgi:hypothetical protein